MLEVQQSLITKINNNRLLIISVFCIGFLFGIFFNINTSIILGGKEYGIHVDSSIPQRIYMERYYARAEELFNIGNYRQASEYYKEYLQSMSYSNSAKKEEKYRIANNRKLASDLLTLNINLETSNNANKYR